MVDPKLWPTKTEEDERDWFVEARPGSANYRGDCVRFVRAWYTDKGLQYTNEPAEDVIAQLLEERDAAIREHQRALGEAAEIAQGLQSKLDEAIRERDLARAHDAQPYPTAEAYERVCAALEAAKRSLEQTRAAMEAGDACTVCAGTGKPVSGKPCICGGHGGIGNQIIGLTREVQRERERADRAEALLREIQPMVVQAVLDPYPVVRERASALLAKIREALGVAK